MSITNSPSVSPQRLSSVSSQRLSSGSDNVLRGSRSPSPVSVLPIDQQKALKEHINNDDKFFTLDTSSTSSSPTPTPASPMLTPAQAAESMLKIFTPQELAEHAPTREYIEQNRHR